MEVIMSSCIMCKDVFKHTIIQQALCSKCSKEIWEDIDAGGYDRFPDEKENIKRWLEPRN